MTAHDPERDVDELLGKDGGEIGHLYRRLPRYEPPRRLDRAVLGEAARAVHSGKPPRRQRWIVGYVGSAVRAWSLAAGIAWRIGHDAMSPSDNGGGHEAGRAGTADHRTAPRQARCAGTVRCAGRVRCGAGGRTAQRERESSVRHRAAKDEAAPAAAKSQGAAPTAPAKSVAPMAAPAEPPKPIPVEPAAAPPCNASVSGRAGATRTRRDSGKIQWKVRIRRGWCCCRRGALRQTTSRAEPSCCARIIVANADQRLGRTPPRHAARARGSAFAYPRAAPARPHSSKPPKACACSCARIRTGRFPTICSRCWK